MSILTDLFLPLVALPAGAAIGLRLAASTRRAPARVATCTGYQGDYFMKTDCDGHRSAFCDDGRCSFHCAQMCKCKESR